MQLVPNWKHGWKWLSLHFIVGAGAVQGAVLAFPQEIKQYVGDPLMHWLAVGLLGAAAAGRMIDQGSHDGGDPK